jgi:3-oxoacyl-[acyl-carrier protein] reductase
MSLEKPVALITGATGGIGRATARMLKEEGFRLALADFDRAKTEAFARELGAYAIAFDLADRGAVDAAAAEIERSCGPVHSLVNNAGVFTGAKSTEAKWDDWHKVMAVNLEAPFALARTLMPGMRARGKGRVVNLCSYAAQSGGITAGTAYTVSKAALIGLTRSLAREYAGSGVTVNGIAPVHVRTPMVTDILDAATIDGLKKLIPVGRLCEPDEIAHVVRFLVHPLAGFITGEIVDVNGGLRFG